jgi:predicted esterase
MSNAPMRELTAIDDPHAGQRVLYYGAPPSRARRAAVLLHGRARSPEDMLHVADKLDVEDVAYVMPAAGGRSWYPLSFLAPVDENEPSLASSLRAIDRVIASLGRQGIRRRDVMVIGFSQGACVALEFGARLGRAYAGIAALSGGLFGPLGSPLRYTAPLENTPVFLGCSDVDQYIPLARVHESADVLRSLGAIVDERIYPGLGHTVNRDEIDALRVLLRLERCAAVEPSTLDRFATTP